MKFTLKEDGKKIIIICLASLLFAVNIKTFVRTGGLYPGGATGLTILIQRCFELFFKIEVPYTLVNVTLNAIPVYIGFRFIGKKFTLYSCLVIFLTGFITDLIPSYVITYDILLISIFGGIINGICVSLCLRMDATSGGTDFIAIYYSQKTKRDSWNLVLCINIIILSLAGILFGWDKALYSIIYQFTSTQVLNALYKRYQQNTLFIVTNKPAQICSSISEITHHGATVMECIGFYQKKERVIVYSVVSRSEIEQVVRSVHEIDQNAFINVLKTEQIAGRFYQRPTE